MSRIIDLTGQIFGRLVVSHRYGNDGKNTTWLCNCECNGPKSANVIVQTYNLRMGKTVSCGCLRKEKVAISAKRHGMRGTKVYKTWINIKDRCYNPKAEAYKNYGGRGITVDDHWKESFENFYNDMGSPPSDEHSIERNDVYGNYTLSNCRWATTTEQSNNKRTSRKMTHDGITLTLSQWAKKVGITPCSLANRLDAGWTDSEALTTPKRGRR
jgi:hypothetical protein